MTNHSSGRAKNRAPLDSSVSAMNPEVIRAPALPVAVAKLGVMMVIGGAVVWLAKAFVFPWMHTYLASGADHAEAVHRAQVVMLVAGVFVLALAAYVTWLGIRVLQQGQWPLAGAFVLRDTAVKRGPWVRARGILLVVLGVMLVADAIGFAVIPHLVLK